MHDYGFVKHNWGATPAARVHGPELDRYEEHRDQCNSGDRDYHQGLDPALQTDSIYHRQLDDNNRVGLERSKPSDGHVLEGIGLKQTLWEDRYGSIRGSSARVSNMARLAQ